MRDGSGRPGVRWGKRCQATDMNGRLVNEFFRRPGRQGVFPAPAFPKLPKEIKNRNYRHSSIPPSVNPEG